MRESWVGPIVYPERLSRGRRPAAPGAGRGACAVGSARVVPITMTTEGLSTRYCLIAAIECTTRHLKRLTMCVHLVYTVSVCLCGVCVW